MQLLPLASWVHGLPGVELNGACPNAFVNRKQTKPVLGGAGTEACSCAKGSCHSWEDEEFLVAFN